MHVRKVYSVRLSEKAWAVFDRFIGLLACVAGFLVIAMMVLMVTEVVTRYILKNPPVWALEVNSYITFGIAFLGTAWLLKIRKHISVDIVVNNMSPGAQLRLNIIVSIVGALILLTITYFSACSTIDHYQRGVAVWQILKFPKFILLLFIPLGCFLTSIQFMRQTYDYTKRLKVFRPERPAERWEEEVRL